MCSTDDTLDMTSLRHLLIQGFQSTDTSTTLSMLQQEMQIGNFQHPVNFQKLAYDKS